MLTTDEQGRGGSAHSRGKGKKSLTCQGSPHLSGSCYSNIDLGCYCLGTVSGMGFLGDTPGALFVPQPHHPSLGARLFPMANLWGRASFHPPPSPDTLRGMGLCLSRSYGHTVPAMAKTTGARQPYWYPFSVSTWDLLAPP